MPIIKNAKLNILPPEIFSILYFECANRVTNRAFPAQSFESFSVDVMSRILINISRRDMLQRNIIKIKIR
jgi:hypothetical protein